MNKNTSGAVAYLNSQPQDMKNQLHYHIYFDIKIQFVEGYPNFIDSTYGYPSLAFIKL